MVMAGSVLDVVIRSAVKAVEARVKVGTQDMLKRAFMFPEGEAKASSAGAETVIKMTETSNSRVAHKTHAACMAC